jgi:hypothetical protein
MESLFLLFLYEFFPDEWRMSIGQKEMEELYEKLVSDVTDTGYERKKNRRDGADR